VKKTPKRSVRKSSKKVLTEEFDIETDDSFSDDAKFNSPEFHKKQHKL